MLDFGNDGVPHALSDVGPLFEGFFAKLGCVLSFSVEQVNLALALRTVLLTPISGTPRQYVIRVNTRHSLVVKIRQLFVEEKPFYMRGEWRQ